MPKSDIKWADATIEALKKNILPTAVCAFAFFAGIFPGYVLQSANPDAMTPVIEEFGGMFSSAGSQLELAAMIFRNNFQVSIIMLATGTLIVVPLLVLAANGLFVGFVYGAFLEEGHSLLDFAAVLLPHGILELPAVFLSAALGMRIGFAYVLPHGNRATAVAARIREAAVVYLTVVLPLLLLAAFVEAYVSASFVPA